MAITHATGYAIHDGKDYTNFKLTKYELEPLTSDRVTVEVECCGVCGSDVHTITLGWGPFNTEFVVPGHEVIGKVVEVGDKVTMFKVGDRVGVGAQVSSCGTCKACKNDNESYCMNHITHGYNTQWEDGHDHQGGYSTHVRAQEHWVYKIPDALQSVDAASMLCGGLTVYSPLVRNGAGPGKKVAVVGLGGLGHYAVLFGAALGAEVTVISRSDAKKADAMKLGAKNFIATQNKDFAKGHEREFDLMISAASAATLPLDDLLSMLDVDKKLVFVGMPEKPMTITPQTLSGNAACLCSSHLGSRKEVLAMLDLAAKKNIKPMIDVIPMKDAAKAVKAVQDSSVRYRTILTQDITQ